MSGPRARVIPSLLLANGRLVKGERFAGHRDAGNPVTTARAHDAQGADELILLDIDASREGRGPDLGAIEAVAKACFMPLAGGGGIRTLSDARAVVAAGADKVVVGAGAFDRPELLSDIASVFGAQAVVLALDIAADGKVHDARVGLSTGRDAIAWAKDAVARGAGEIRLCSVAREGTRAGFDLDAISALRAAVRVPIIAEGGCGTLDDIPPAFLAGADAVGLGTMLVFSDNNLVKVRRYLAGHGLHVRI